MGVAGDLGFWLGQSQPSSHAQVDDQELWTIGAGPRTRRRVELHEHELTVTADLLEPPPADPPAEGGDAGIAQDPRLRHRGGLDSAAFELGTEVSDDGLDLG